MQSDDDDDGNSQQSIRVAGSVAGVYRFCDGSISFPFKVKSEGDVLQLQDPDRLLPSYSVTIDYILDVSVPEHNVIVCRSAKRKRKTLPLNYSKMRWDIGEYSRFGGKRLTAVFKGKAKQRYNTMQQMLEDVCDEDIRNTLYRLYDRHFQPEEYYFVACYLQGPDLLEKGSSALKKLQNMLLFKPSLCCFLSSFIELEAARGVYDMSIESLRRFASLTGKQEELAFSADFEASLNVYMQWMHETTTFGLTKHKLPSSDSNIDYLLEQKLVQPLSDGSYCLFADWTYGDGAIARAVSTLLERVPVDERRKQVIDEFSYEPHSMPLLLLQHYGLNHYACLKHIIQEWECNNTDSDIVVLSENTYHARLFEEQVGRPVRVYCQGTPPALSNRLGLLVIEQAQLWSSICLGRLLQSLEQRLYRLNIILSGDARQMPAFPGRGQGAAFSDLQRSSFFPIIYATESSCLQPTVITAALMTLLKKGSRSQSWERAYNDLECMKLSDFINETHMKTLKKIINSSEDEMQCVRILCKNKRTKQQIYNEVRKNVWNESNWDSSTLHSNELIYSNKLKMCMQAHAIECIMYEKNRALITTAEYETKRKFSYCKLNNQNVTDSVFLKDAVTEETFKVNLRYSEGLYPATVDTYSRMQTCSHVDYLYLFIDSDTAWRVLYTALVQTRKKLCLVYPDECSNVHELLDHIVDKNWKKYGRSGALAVLLKDLKSDTTEQPVNKRQRRE